MERLKGQSIGWNTAVFRGQRNAEKPRVASREN